MLMTNSRVVVRTKPSNPYQNERGSITVLFCVLAAIVIGTVSYSLYMGYQVEQKIALYNSADAGSFGAAGHTSQGLNMMAANNLTIGAALHVAAAVPIVAAYGSLVYAFTTDIWDSAEELVKKWSSKMTFGVVKMLDRYQKAIWNPLANITAFYLRIATGLTGFNQFIADYWLIPAPLRAIEMARLNLPDTLALPLQKSLLLGGANIMQYGGIKVTNPKQTLCHTLEASEGIEGRGDFGTWLFGPLLTFGETIASVAKILNKVTGFAEKYLPVTITFVDCGYGVETSILHLFQNIAKGVTNGMGVEEALERGKAVSTVSKITKRVSDTGDDWCHALDLSDAGASELIRMAATYLQEELPARHLYYQMLQKWQEDVENSPPKPIAQDFECRREFERWKSGNRFYRRSYKTFADCDKDWQAHFLAASARWPNERSPYRCEQPNTGVELWDHVEHITSTGEKTCLNLRTMDPGCALQKYINPDYLGLSGLVCGGKIRKKIKKWKERCERDFYDKGAAAPEKIKIVDWGTQLDTYINGGTSGLFGVEFSWGERDVNKQIGFSYIDDSQAFADSSEFVVIAANAGRIDGETCPPELVYTESEETYCGVPAMKGFAEWYVEAEVPETAKQRRLHMRHMSAGAEALWLKEEAQMRGSWKRAQWVISGARVIKAQPRTNHKLDLFWPDWHPQLTRPTADLFNRAVEHIATPDQASSLSTLYP